MQGIGDSGTANAVIRLCEILCKREEGAFCRVITGMEYKEGIQILRRAVECVALRMEMDACEKVERQECDG